ncbi:hypothetical protein ACWCQN_22865 [Streptomyces sp. NPDC001984]
MAGELFAGTDPHQTPLEYRLCKGAVGCGSHPYASQQTDKPGGHPEAHVQDHDFAAGLEQEERPRTRHRPGHYLIQQLLDGTGLQVAMGHPLRSLRGVVRLSA